MHPDSHPFDPPADLRRYRRHLALPEVGERGQLRLREASVLCVGAGGLGSPLAIYLTAAGIGRLGLVDFDHVDITNLQRQVLYGTNDVGRPKLEAAQDALQRLNPDVEIVPHPVRLDPSNAREVLTGYDLVADGTDNFPTRYLVNDACVLLGIPNVYASILRFEGRASVFGAPHGPCYRCLYPHPPPPGSVPGCAEAGVLGVLPGLLGAIQATEAVKMLLGIGRPLVGRMLLVDALAMTFRELTLRRDPQCPCCGDHPTITSLQTTGSACPTPAPQEPEQIDVHELQARLAGPSPPLLLDVREAYEVELSSLPNARHIPLGQLPQRLQELDALRDIVVYCHLGPRSTAAARLLLQSGFTHVSNLRGGILAWATHVDPSMPRY